MVRKSQIAGKCVFCGATGLTKEHIWSDWLNKELPSTSQHTQTLTDMIANSLENTVHIQPFTPSSRQGGITRRTLRNVCKGCNNGWMKAVVDRAVPYARPLIHGDGLTLDAAAQLNLAAWLALSTIMAQMTGLPTMRSPPSDRAIIRDSSLPPPSWTISVGQYSGSAWHPARYRQWGGPIIKAPTPGNPLGANSTSFQIATTTLGSLIVQTFSSTDESLVEDYREHFVPLAMRQIFPVKATLSLPATSTVFDDEYADLIADGFKNVLLRSTMK